MSIALNIFLILFLIIAAYFWYGFNAAIKKKFHWKICRPNISYTFFIKMGYYNFAYSFIL